ncbi:MAG: DUF3667 domain-containing protein [Bacteroidota bacterium]
MGKKCLNCDSELNDDVLFCPQCGQKANLHRISMHEILHELMHFFTHADKSFLNLLKLLVVKNGQVAREYLSGKRKKYFPPLNFFLLTATIFVFIATLTHPSRATVQDVLKSHPEISHIPTQAGRDHVTGIYLRSSAVGAFMSKYSNIVAMIATPMICFIYWIFYSRGRFTYVEHLVGCFYMVGFGNLIYACLITPLTMLIGREYALIAQSVFFVLQVIYNSVYYYHFINRRSSPALFKAIGVSVLAIAFWVFLTSSLIRLYIEKG